MRSIVLKPTMLLLLITLFGHSWLANCQKARGLESVLADFKSVEVQRREYAYYDIQDNSKALRRPEVRAALIELLNRENNDPKVSSYGEGYLEYLFDLTDTVVGFID